MSTNIGYIQWLFLVKPTLKVALVDRNRSLVAHTSKCGWAISVDFKLLCVLDTYMLS